MKCFFVKVSKMGPLEVVNVGDIVTCYVDEIFPEKGKVALTLMNPNKNF